VKVAIALSALTTILGGVWLGLLSPNHVACSNALVESLNYSTCQGIDVDYVVANLMLGAGALGFIVTLFLILKTSRGT
jgi:hypothetical protein